MVPDCTPRFAKVDPFDDRPLAKIELEFPFWLKPVKAYRSQLAFKIHNEREFDDSLRIIREKIGRFAEPLDFFLERLTLPDDMAGVHGGFCIAEEVLTGRQGALEGFMCDGEAEVYGFIDSIKEESQNPFSSFQHPSTLPQPAQRAVADVALAAVRAIGLEHSPFNVEFFMIRIAPASTCWRSIHAYHYRTPTCSRRWMDHPIRRSW